MSEEYPTFADGRYRIESRLGDGGMAAVFRAWDTRLHVYRAIKCLDPNLSVHPQIRDRFEVEARTMASINHPNIVAVQDIGNEGVRFFIIMELLTGGSLWDRVEKHGVLHPQYAIDAAIAMAKGLGAAHDKKIIHRDVKPHNVLISKDGIPKVTDFGIARIDDGTSKTKTGAVMGTLNYMAPEQRLSARRATAVSDLYAVGVSLYAMMTGHSNEDLFEEEEQDIAFSNFDDNIATFLRKACHRDPKKRHVDAKDMIDELTVLKGKIEAVPEGTSPLFIPFEDSGFDEKPSREEMTRLHTSWSEYGSKDGKIQNSGGSDDTLNIFGDDDDFLGDMNAPTTLENGGVANPMQAQTIAPQMGTMVPGMGQTMHPGMNPNMVGTFHPGMNPNMGQTMHPNMGQTMHPGMNQMASGTFHPGMSVPPGTMQPNVNPSMNQTVMPGMQTNPNLSLSGERTVFQTGEQTETSAPPAKSNMGMIIGIVVVLIAGVGFFATQGKDETSVKGEKTSQEDNQQALLDQMKKSNELKEREMEQNRIAKERGKLEAIEDEVERFEKLIAFDEKILSEKKTKYTENYAGCLGEQRAKLASQNDGEALAEFKCKKEFGDGDFSDEKSQIEQLKKDLAAAKTKKEEEAKKKAQKTKRKSSKKTNTSSTNAAPVQNLNAVPQGFGFIEIRSIPPFSGLTIDGKSKKANAFGGYQSKKDAPLVATKHVITIYSPTGGQKSKTVMLRPDETFRYCWDFIEEAKCKK